MQTRKPIVAGRFYPAQHDSCVDEINEFLEQLAPDNQLPETVVAGIVPHAGWTFSGALAVQVLSAIKQQNGKVHTFIILGAGHSYFGQAPALYDRGIWTTPLGDVAIDEELADAVLEKASVVSDPQAHSSEHSIEVQVPFIQYLFAGAKILPIVTPPTEQAVSLGEVLGDIIASKENRKIICIGSTDLTHYGSSYGFTPMGTTSEALDWAEKVNDRQFIDLALNIKPHELLTNALENQNACGPGAAAATVAAAKKLGKTKGTLLAHTNSNRIMQAKMAAKSADSVGYAAIVF
jgi:AmmeMemoRadiSam system protein B